MLSTPEEPGSSPGEQLDEAGSPCPWSGSHAQPQEQPLHSRHFRSPCANHVRVTPAAKTARAPTSCDKDEGAPGTEREDGVLGTRPSAWQALHSSGRQETQPHLFPEPSARVAGASDPQGLSRCEGDRGRRAALSRQPRDSGLARPLVPPRSREEASCVVTTVLLGPHASVQSPAPAHALRLWASA